MCNMNTNHFPTFRYIVILYVNIFFFFRHVVSESDIPSVYDNNTTTESPSFDSTEQYSNFTSTSDPSQHCSDDNNFVFLLETGVQKRCSWFQRLNSKKEEKMAMYCKDKDIAMNCRLSCGMCTTTETFASSFAPWSFVVFADIHGLTPFAFDPLDENLESWQTSLDILKNIKHTHLDDDGGVGGGEIVLLPGDVLSFGGMSNPNIVKKLGQPSLSETESIYTASKNCYKTTKELFRQAGYGTVLAAVGDHELGGNYGFRVRKKLPTVPSYREGFASGWNKNQTNGEFMFHDLIMGMPSRPLGTPFEGSSFAYRYKNALFVSVDAFRLVGDGDANYMDRERGFGGEGAITCDVTGDHLVWFEDILKAARSNDSTIQHIFVQAHLPILQPVRKVQCSGQFFDGADDSDFWRVMNKYNVDLYFAGEVHSNTVTKTGHEGSNLIQIVSRSVSFSGFLIVKIIDGTIEVKHYNEIGTKKKFNNNYIEDGYLKVNKTLDIVRIDSGGELQLLDTTLAILYFDFEEVFPLGHRQILGLSGDTSLIGFSIEIDGINCTESVINHGSFGSQYDAQVHAIEIMEGMGIDGGRAGKFYPSSSRFSIFGTGPFSGGEIFSLSLWINTERSNLEQILIYYGALWSSIHEGKDYFMLTLDHGIPTIYRNSNISRKAVGTNSTADGQWHNLVVSMPRKSCLFSEIKIYVDGYQVDAPYTVADAKDENVFFMTSGRMNVGGLGYSHLSVLKESNFSKVPFDGYMDDISIWSRTLDDIEIVKLSRSGDVNQKPSYASSEVFSTSISNSTGMPSGSKSPSIAPSYTPIFHPPIDGCNDEVNFTFKIQNNEEHYCQWLVNDEISNNQSLKEMICGIDDIRLHCRFSCGVCQEVFWTSSSSFHSVFQFWGLCLVSAVWGMYIF